MNTEELHLKFEVFSRIIKITGQLILAKNQSKMQLWAVLELLFRTSYIVSLKSSLKKLDHYFSKTEDTLKSYAFKKFIQFPVTGFHHPSNSSETIDWNSPLDSTVICMTCNISILNFYYWNGK